MGEVGLMGFYDGVGGGSDKVAEDEDEEDEDDEDWEDQGGICEEVERGEY